MPTYLAKIENETVVNIIVGELEDFPDHIAIDVEDLDVRIGDTYVNGEFVRQPIVYVPPPEARFITLGAFKDRLGINALALAVSTNPICAALREMLYDREYLDLQRDDLRNYLMLLVNNNLPESRPEFPNSGPLTTEIVDKILNEPTTVAERPTKLY